MKMRVGLLLMVIVTLLVGAPNVAAAYHWDRVMGSTIFVGMNHEFTPDSIIPDGSKDFAVEMASSTYRLVSADQKYLDRFVVAAEDTKTGFGAYADANYCTAFLVADDIVLTARHCLFRAQDGNATPNPAVLLPYDDPTDIQETTLIGIDNTNDMAALRVKPQRDRKPIPIAASNPEYTSKAIVLGFPGTLWLPLKPFDLTASETTVYPNYFVLGYDTYTAYKNAIRGKVKTGNSGGPVVNLRGELIGIVNSISMTYDVTFMARVPDLNRFVDGARGK